MGVNQQSSTSLQALLQQFSHVGAIHQFDNFRHGSSPTQLLSPDQPRLFSTQGGLAPQSSAPGKEAEDQ